jgi:hypothetical protein
MSFNLESGKNREINETLPEVKVDSEQLSETEETAENFDDCALNEVQDSKGNEVNAESLEEAEENYDDCEAKMEVMEEKNPELTDEDDDFNDCGKETDGQYVAEVTYTTDGEISQEEAWAELEESYNECDDPEDMQQLKENANENEHIEVHNAEVIERPENGDVADEVTEEEYEQAQEEMEEAQETLEAQQEAAQEYNDDLENQINKHENDVPEGTENINNDASEDTEEKQEDMSETEEGTDEGEDSDVEENTEDDMEHLEDTEDTEASKAEENAEDVESDGGQVEEQAENTDKTAEASDENNEDTSSEAEENAEDIESDGEQVEEQAENTDEIAETSDDNDKGVNENISSKAEENAEDVESDDLEQMDDDTNVEASEINNESVSEDISQQVEEQTETELSDETKEKIQEDVDENIDDEAEDGKVSAEKAEELINENVEENVDNIEEQKESADETIGTRADEIVENEDLTEDEVKEQITDEVKESTDENLSDEEAETIAEEKSNEIEDVIEEKKEEQESVEAIEKTAEELENNQIEQDSEVERKSLQERIDGAFEKDDVSSSEINDLREENATELETQIEEKAATKAELKSKFDEVLSKEKGSEEYKQSLREYNDLQDQKANLDERIAIMEKQQDLLDKKRLELREAQIQNGAEAVATSAATLAGVNALQERYDQTYYDRKPNKAELANIREESCSIIKELSAEKDSIKQAMDAKMDEISEYVTSNNMDRYDTAHDLRYQQLSAEYNAMKESYNRIGYSFVKLDENNKAITEQLGDEYVSMAELPPASKISEVNTGTDIPGETNYFVDGAKASEVLSPFKQDNWEQLSVKEQKQAVEKLADYNAEILGVEDKPQIVFFNKPPKDVMIERGYYDPNNNSIFINEHCLNDSAGIADTVSHEYRHKYQHQRADKLENERDLAFRENFDNYQSAGNDYASYSAYRNQLVEVDARAYGQVIKDKITSTEVSNTEIKFDNNYKRVSIDFSETNPEKGAVCDKVAVSEPTTEVDEKENEVKNFKELRNPKEVFEAEEIAEIKEKVAPAYENGVSIAKKIKDGGFDTYKEHNDLESGHIEKVREKSVEAAEVLSEHFSENDYDGLYSPNIDCMTVEMMAIYHDTGMDANIDADKFNGELSAKQIRDAHSLQSAIHALRDRDFIESKAVNADEVALGCLLHSKSNSGVSNLSSDEQWGIAVSRLKQGVDDFNKANPSEQITFDTAFIMNEDASLKPEVLAELRSESLALRIGDANGHDSKSDVSQSGKDIKFDLQNCELQNCEYSAETIKKIEEADRSGLLSEVEHSDVYVGDKLLTNDDDETGISRAFSLGEGNFKRLSFEVNEGKPSEIVQLENCDAYPLSTQFCIEERIREINTAKIDDDYVPERLPGMSDEQDKKLKNSYADQTAKIDSQIIIDLPNAFDTTLKSYKNFAVQMAQKYNIEVKVRQ